MPPSGGRPSAVTATVSRSRATVTRWSRSTDAKVIAPPPSPASAAASSAVSTTPSTVMDATRQPGCIFQAATAVPSKGTVAGSTVALPPTAGVTSASTR